MLANPPDDPPDELKRVKDLVSMLPGISATGITRSEGRWALKVWPEQSELILKPVIDALCNGHPVVYATQRLNMKGGAPRPPARVSGRPSAVVQRCWNWLKQQPVFAGLIASLVACVLALGLVGWQWRSTAAELRVELSQRNRELERVADDRARGERAWADRGRELSDAVARGGLALAVRDKSRRALKLANAVIEASLEFSEERLSGKAAKRQHKRFLEQAVLHYQAIVREYDPSSARLGDDEALRTYREAQKGLERASNALRTLETLIRLEELSTDRSEASEAKPKN
jgi:hypothetical protein